MSTSGLTGDQRRFLIELGLPSLALALAVTTVSSLLPVVLQALSGTALAGGLLGIEGLFALFAVPVIGAWSDRLETSLGPRLPFVLAGVPLIVLALVLLPLAQSLWLAALLLIVFYCGYFAYFTPHFAMYMDLVSEDLQGRSQGVMNTLREVGLALALVGGPALLTFGQGVPFGVAAAIVAGISLLFVAALLRRPEARKSAVEAGEGRSFGDQVLQPLRTLRGDRHVRLAVLANSLWETALNALRAFVVLYFTVGLGFSGGKTSLVLLLVAGAAMVAAPISGRLSDRYGDVRVLRIASVVYAAGVWVPAFFHSIWVIAIVPPVSVAAVIVMTLPFSLLMSVLPEESGEHEGGGRGSGVFGISRGIGLLLGPLLGALAIYGMKDALPQTDGYGAIFLVAGVAVALSALVMRRLPLDLDATAKEG